MSRGQSTYDEARLQGRLWTPRAIIGHIKWWLDASDLGTISASGGKVNRWADKSGRGLDVLQATAQRMPELLYGGPVLDGRYAVGNSVQQNSYAKSLISAQNIDFSRIYTVSYYKTGTETSFDVYSALICNDALSYRIMGQGGTNSWLYNNTVLFYNSTPFVNGRLTASLVALPMPLTVSRFDCTTSNMTLCVCGGTQAFYPERSWVGGICEVIATSRTEGAFGIQLIEGYLAWKWGVNERLSTDNRFKNRPPLIGE